MVAYLNGLGGLHTLEDFATAAGHYVTPVTTEFRGYTVHECPPNGQGIIALLILNILSRFEAKGDPQSPDRLHIELEATRLAYAARDAWLADPEKADVPVDEILSDALADRLAAMIDLRRARTDLPSFDMPLHRDTVYISVVDRDRNAVSLINSVFDSFGTGLVAPRSGVLLHNRGQSFSLTPGHPNVIAPLKRPLHTIIPGMVTRGGRVEMPFGVMGGYYQAMGHAHLISKLFRLRHGHPGSHRPATADSPHPTARSSKPNTRSRTQPPPNSHGAALSSLQPKTQSAAPRPSASTGTTER